MPIIPWNCAHADAPWITIPCEEEIALGAADSDRVIITGSGTIKSFGPSPVSFDMGVCCTKTVFFDPSGVIVVKPSSHIALLGSGDRIIRGKSFGTFSCDSFGFWAENAFTDMARGPSDFDVLVEVLYEMCQDPELKSKLDKLRIRHKLS